MDEAERHIQLALTQVTRWVDVKGLHSTHSKTLAISLTLIRGSLREPLFNLYGRRILMVKDMILGNDARSLSDMLSHLQTLTAACIWCFFLLCVPSHFSWETSYTLFTPRVSLYDIVKAEL